MPSDDVREDYGGMTSQVKPESPLTGEYSAKVMVVDRVMDAASGTFGVRMELPNPHLKLPAGLKCSVSFGKK
jgi:membrane fusion protein, multidrug efflux system